MGNLTAAGAAWVLSGGRLVDRCLYLALRDSSGDELAGAGYARQPLVWVISGTPTESTTTACTFTASGGDWAEAVDYAMCDAPVGGTVYAEGEIEPGSVTLLDGHSLVFSVGAVTLQVQI